MTSPTRLLLFAWGSLALGSPAAWASSDCVSLYAASLAKEAGVEDCDTPLSSAVSGAPSQCVDAGHVLTANACSHRLYLEPEQLSLRAGSLPMTAEWIQPCRDGTEDCLDLNGDGLIDPNDPEDYQPEAVCTDGTRPMVYVDQAVATDPATGELVDITSQRWVFHMSGTGGPCDDDDCWEDYDAYLDAATQAASLSTAHPHLTTGATSRARGIVSNAPSPAVGGTNPLAHYNRVTFNRCSDSAGNATVTAALDEPSMTARTADVYHRGDAIWESLTHTVSSPEFRALDDCDAQSTDLPALQTATHILLTASSDAGEWLIVNGDRIVSYFQRVAPGAELRIAIDGMYQPMLQTENSYHSGSELIFGESWEDVDTTWQLPPSGVPGASAEYGERFLPEEPDISWDVRGYLGDASCEAHLATHGGDPRRCRDYMHLMMEHVSTPVFVVADQHDRIMRNIIDHTADETYRYTEADHRDRLVHQAADAMRFHDTDSALADDPAWTPTGSRAFFLPRRDGHVHFNRDDHFAGTWLRECSEADLSLRTLNLPNALHAWLSYDAPVAAWEHPDRYADPLDRAATDDGHYWLAPGEHCGIELPD